MLALSIVLAGIVLLLLLPVGADFAFLESRLHLSLKIGPAKILLFPRRSKVEPKRKKNEKSNKEKRRNNQAERGKKPHAKLTRQDLTEILHLGLRILGKLRRGIRIDRFLLHITVATNDPYDTVVQYGRICAILGTLSPLVHRAFRVCKEDVGVQMCFEDEKMSLDAAMTATFRIGCLLLIALCAAAGAIAWLFRRKKRTKQMKRDAVLTAKAQKGC